MLIAKIHSFFLFLFEVKGFKNKIKFLIILLWAALTKTSFEQEIPFRFFYLRWHVGSGELTPYFEIKDLFLTELFPSEDVKKWTILDGGANIGQFSLFFKQAKFIVAVEPVAQCHGVLRYNFLKNGVKGVTVEKALSKGEGKLRMVFDPKASVLSKVSLEGNYDVISTTVDALMKEHEIEKLDLLKLDLEGGEIDALEGALNGLENKKIERIYAEFNTTKHLKDLDEFLVNFGYRRKRTFGYNALWSLS